MNNHLTTYLPNPVRTLLINAGAVGLILGIPAIAHVTGVPVYFIEPMRVALVISIVFTSRLNAYVLAMVLPLVSYLVSGHPFPAKMMIITAELVLNTYLFIMLFSKTGKTFISMLLAILLSKGACYLLYWIFLGGMFVAEEAGILFIAIQLVVTVCLSTVTLLLSRKYEIISLR